MDLGASERTPDSFADAELLGEMRAGNSAAFAAFMRSNNQRRYRSLVAFLKMIWRPRRPPTTSPARSRFPSKSTQPGSGPRSDPSSMRLVGRTVPGVRCGEQPVIVTGGRLRHDLPTIGTRHAAAAAGPAAYPTALGDGGAVVPRVAAGDLSLGNKQRVRVFAAILSAS
jgi:hypothetical protein